MKGTTSILINREKIGDIEYTFFKNIGGKYCLITDDYKHIGGSFKILSTNYERALKMIKKEGANFKNYPNEY